MDFKISLRAILYLALLAVLSKAVADSALIGLKNNPFSRPQLKVEDLPAKQKVVRQQAPRNPVSIFIEATLVSKNGSMVIVNGKLIAIGGSIEGMKLVKVGEGMAVFRHGSKLRTFKVGVLAEI